MAQQTVEGQLEGIGAPEEVGTDGLWVKLRGGAKRVVLLVVDSVTGLVWPPVVTLGEECEEAWAALFERAKKAGMELDRLRGVTSDGAQGLLAYISRGLYWVQHQRCIWHLWRTLGRLIKRAASQAAEGVAEPLVKEVRRQVRDELKALVRGVIDASSYEAAEGALASLPAHALGAPLAQVLIEQWDRLLVYQLDYYRGLQRVSPEWYWRAFRMRLNWFGPSIATSRPRNGGRNVSVAIGILVRVPCRWLALHQETSATSMRWASECSRIANLCFKRRAWHPK